ncbi:DUF6153 family protein [Streptomyces radiopugnans]|uniref:DUF6153 family protein n=1 Tax=Streptomyces radiopugnans TaxID=403935 RepID=UPI003F1CE1C8
MNRRPHPPIRPHRARVRMVLLVLAVLAGVVAMHGLGPVGAAAPSDVPRTALAAGHAMPSDAGTAAHGSPGGAAGDACAHPDHGTNGHPNHADATCAAVGTSGPPVLPTLLASATPAADAAATGPAPSAALAGRAPPSLSELQLLRI